METKKCYVTILEKVFLYPCVSAQDQFFSSIPITWLAKPDNIREMALLSCFCDSQNNK